MYKVYKRRKRWEVKQREGNLKSVGKRWGLGFEMGYGDIRKPYAYLEQVYLMGYFTENYLHSIPKFLSAASSCSAANNASV